MINYLFDVDGTLTPSRGVMDSDFQRLFIRFLSRERKAGNKVFFVTGSDKDKTIEQVGLQLWMSVDGSFQNSGNQFYKKGKFVSENDWTLPKSVENSIRQEITNSVWNGTASNNLEKRVGMVNISTVGRDCTQQQRSYYYQWDLQWKEREGIVSRLSAKYPELEFVIGGQISIDVYPKGIDKSQVLKEINGRTVFFGDNCLEGGNDYSISKLCDEYYNVRDWKATKDILSKPMTIN